MAQEKMEEAARESGGRFYTLADADRVPDDLPSGVRVSISASGKRVIWWNSLGLFLLALGLLTTIWVLRKQLNLL
jgi:hypothetical protein